MVAFYKHKKQVKDLSTLWARIVDDCIGFVTRSQYTHCELVEMLDDYGRRVHMYSSSPRDGGVRVKKYQYLDPLHWDLLPVPKAYRHKSSGNDIAFFADSCAGCKYDWLGVLAFVLPWLKGSERRFFCSEFVATFLELRSASKISPAMLYLILYYHA